MKKTAKTWLRLGISLGLLLVLLFFFVDLGQAWRAVSQARWEFLVLLLAAFTLDRCLMSYKWRLLLISQGYPAGHGEALKAYYLATFAGCFLPSTLGSDAIRVGLFARPDRPSQAVAASIFLERALGFVAAALAAVIGLVLLTGITTGLPTQFFYWAFGLLAAACLAVLLSFTAWAERLHGQAERRWRERSRLLAWLLDFVKAYHQYRRNRGVLLWFLFLSFIEQGAPVIFNWLIAKALHLDLTLLESAAVTPAVFFLARLPVSFSSFGVLEGLYVAFFSLVGIGSTSAFLIGFLVNLGSMASALPAIPMYLRGGVDRAAPPAPPGGSSA
ncbi:MAG: flippase-like domain-containing protein [Desulfarculus sp.]|nr:flippase-like domain-containing protein [Pseudomonadota bacterium]MBV1715143.1 flippase-like domain-containing protein [Desulfarculus sp.]MBU4574359.1 flippase-like domain-containing protein [Pseudomonadota bacterium]MBU4598827.1 flippase-like domain-containing protein [Pseudomonadota bacterium]MBV1736641.1 flippase-like domain-containing protein [Desulfarculus sp.]